MSARLTLVAHASTAATAGAVFAGDDGLEPRGAAAAAAVRPLRRVGRAVCSPARAAIETAAALGLAAVADARLADWDLGAWRGRALDAVAAAHPAEVAAWLADPDAAPHGGESLTALLARVGGWLAAADGPDQGLACAPGAAGGGTAAGAGPGAMEEAGAAGGPGAAEGSGTGLRSGAAGGPGAADGPGAAGPGGAAGREGAAGRGGAAGRDGAAGRGGSAGAVADRHTVAVTHAAVVRAAVVVALGAPAAGFWRVDVAPLTATVLRGGPGRWTLRGTALPLGGAPVEG